jgi:hypothetical protein
MGRWMPPKTTKTLRCSWFTWPRGLQRKTKMTRGCLNRYSDHAADLCERYSFSAGSRRDTHRLPSNTELPHSSKSRPVYPPVCNLPQAARVARVGDRLLLPAEFFEHLSVLKIGRRRIVIPHGFGILDRHRFLYVARGLRTSRWHSGTHRSRHRSDHRES